MKLSGWGQYPCADVQVCSPRNADDLLQIISEAHEGSQIARGLGRSYGDSALADQVIQTDQLDHLLNFNPETGLLLCSSGSTLKDILEVFVPKGWFLPVTPGTQYVSVGGAIASDVHGKNHHNDGCFSEFVESINIAIPQKGMLEISRDIHPELFYATCGGMGLTGVIVSAQIRLMRISSSFITTKTIKTRNLKETLEKFEQHAHATYSVAWIDCLARGDVLGRSIISLGEPSEEGGLATDGNPQLSVPCNAPNFLLNKHSIKAFNALYYRKTIKHTSISKVHYVPFFYPLDAIRNWNRLYGKKGFMQYQFVLPKESGTEALGKVLSEISKTQQGSFLAVLKALGKENSNLLSFPREGYTLALDFKRNKQSEELFTKLNSLVLKYGGRHYLAKDSIMPEKVFKESYPQWIDFQEIRSRYGALDTFQSLQSIRLGL